MKEVPSFLMNVSKYHLESIIVKILMIGFGDSDSPDTESVDLLEHYLIEYIQNIALLAYKRSKRKGFNDIQLKDLLYIIKNDKKKYYRVPSLLSFYEILKKTKKKLDSNLSNRQGIKKHLKYLAQENN
jgi:hypothetical protein